MPKTATIDLRERIIATLTKTDSCLWFPHLTDDLMEAGWRNLEKEIGITVSNYGTERVILKDATASRDVLFLLPIYNDSESSKVNIQIEELSRDTIQQYENSGVNFYNKKEIISSEVLNYLKNAFQIIGKVPSLLTSVLSLVKSLHIIKSESDEYDVSFSEPNIPFSIFVSVPQKNNELNALRVAEAIVHEAMHLQLTLIEQFIPLVVNNENTYYSPWKKEYRTPQGLLHSLYVFGVIGEFLEVLIPPVKLNKESLEYITARYAQIAHEVEQINTFQSCPDLASVGIIFANNLFRKLVN